MLKKKTAVLLTALILMAGLAATAAAQSKTKVDLNTADLKTIAALPGISDTLAQRIIDGRPYKKLDDLLAVKGIGQAKIDGLKDLVSFSKVKPVKDETVKTDATETAEKTLINVNKADLKTLITLPGIGEATAQKIIDGRPYKTLDDLGKVKGISEAKLKGLKDLVSFEDKVKDKTTRTTTADKTKTTDKAEEMTLINVNKADLKTLETLPGISAVLAQRIIDGRPYKTLDDLGKVKGIGEARLKGIKDQVIFEDKVKDKTAKTTTTKDTTAADKTKTATETAQETELINVNKADLKTLVTLPGISDILAKRIIDGRPYKTLDDLGKVKGIGEAKLKGIKDLISFEDKAKETDTAAKLKPGEKININTATAEDLDKLWGIGEVKSKAIVDYRKANGNFKLIEDIMKVPGIKEGEFAKIKDLIKVK